MDDPRNTDNAWTETTAFHFHCSAELGAQLQLSAGDDARDVAWLDVDVEEERYSKLYGAHRALVDKVASGMQDTWTASAWLSQLEVAMQVAKVLLGGARPFNELQAVRALAAVTTSEAELAERLRAGDVATALAKVLLPALQKLAEAPAATGGELNVQHGKFVQEGKAFSMQYADLSTFFGGLEKKIGPPDPKVREAMEAEHTKRADSHEEFTTGNYGVTTTPEQEWWFVADPERDGVVWPVEEKLLEAQPDVMRKPLPLAELLARRDEVNQTLRAQKEPELVEEECIGARSYTGPMCGHRLHLVPAQLHLVPALASESPLPSVPLGSGYRDVRHRCSPFAHTPSRAWSLGPTPNAQHLPCRFVKYNDLLRGFGPALEGCRGNRYVTTTHVINSAIVKVSKLTTATKVYRGVAGGVLPESFWRANEHGVKGGVENAFMSTTFDRKVAMHYAGSRPGQPALVFEVRALRPYYLGFLESNPLPSSRPEYRGSPESNSLLSSVRDLHPDAAARRCRWAWSTAAPS